MEKIKVNENLIRNILLCDPITARGREKLVALGLAEKIGPKEFFDPTNGLWVEPFSEKEESEMLESDPTDPSPYSFEHARFTDIWSRRNIFNKRFEGEAGARLTTLMGVVGSGKSIEIQRRIFENSGEAYLPYRHDDFDGMYSAGKSIVFPATPDAILIDLEYSKKEVTKGDSYNCPDRDNPLWLFCTTLLDTLVYYIIFLHREHREKLKSVSKNIQYYFKNEEKYVLAVDDQTVQLFDAISRWAGEGPDKLEDVFKRILSLLDSKPTTPAKDRDTSPAAAERDIGTLLKLLYLTAFCVNPLTPKTIIIDNLEDYVATGDTDSDSQAAVIRVSNEEVKKIYNFLRDAEEFYRNRAGDVWTVSGFTYKPSCSIFLVARRTTVELLEPTTYLNTHNPRIGDLFDITGDTSIVKIWRQKKKILWDTTEILKENCEEDVAAYISFADRLICDAAKESSVQQKAARMFAHGLRRIGQNESVIIYKMYGLLTGKPRSGEGTAKYIDMEAFKAISKGKDAAKYLLRQAVMEYYFLLQFKKTQQEKNHVGQRWRNLNIGHLAPKEKTGTYFDNYGRKRSAGAPIWKYSKVIYADGNSIRAPQWRTFLHRILCILEKHQKQGIEAEGCVGIAPTYEPISIYYLMKELFAGYNADPMQEEFAHLAEVLLAAGNPERNGDYAPLLLMRITQEEATPVKLQYKLKAIWDEGKKGGEAEDLTLLDIKKYGVRLSEAGQAFLAEWQPSFSFFAALYCSNQPPLFFIKDKEMIISVLNKVYYYACSVIDAYAIETGKYFESCNEPIHEITEENQLAASEGRLKTFRQQIRTLHKRYLNLYADYISCYGDILGLSHKDKGDLMSTAYELRDRYDSAAWKEYSEIERIEDPIKRKTEEDENRVCF